jgi:hypothetical protein
VPITITPSKCVDIDVSNAREGELIAVTLENGQVLFLGWHVPEDDSRWPHFTFDERWLPQDLLDQCERIACQIVGSKTSRQAYKARASASEDYHEFLSKELRRKVYVAARDASFGAVDYRYQRARTLDVGLTPYAYLRQPRPDTARLLGWSEQWVAAAPIKRIQAVTEYDVELYKSSVQYK